MKQKHKVPKELETGEMRKKCQARNKRKAVRATRKKNRGK